MQVEFFYKSSNYLKEKARRKRKEGSAPFHLFFHLFLLGNKEEKKKVVGLSIKS